MPILEKYTSADFSAHLNQPFLLELDTLPPILLQLRAVQKLDTEATSHSAYRNGRFAVVFHGPLRPILPQQVYRVEHPAMGKLELLFTPVGPSGASMQYKATPV